MFSVTVFESSPLPISCVLQVLFLPGLYFLGRRLAAAAAQPGWPRSVVGGTVALAVWLIAVQLSARFTGSFVAALWLGTGATGIAGYAALRFFPIDDSGAVTTAPPARRVVPWALLAAVPILLAGLGGDIHDELHVYGHQSSIRQLQNDEGTIRNLALPEKPLRYHYGFNLVCAAVTAWFRISAPLAIDLVTTAGWVCSWLLLYLIGTLLFDKPVAGPFTAWITLFGGGLVWLASPWLTQGTWPERLAAFVTTGSGVSVNPPVVSYGFQHPFSLGIPVALAAVYAALLPTNEKDRSVDVVLALLLTALSLLQSALFIALLASITTERVLFRRRGSFLLWAALAGLGARELLGMFTPIADAPPLGIDLRFWAWHDKSIRVAAWNGLTYGMLFPLGLLGLFHLTRGRWIIGTLALGGFAIPNLAVYRYSWDIVKFATIAQIFLGIATAHLLARWYASADRRLRATAIACIPLSTGASVTFLFAVFYSQWFTGRPESFSVQPKQLTRDQSECVDWLRLHGPRTQLIYCPEPSATGYLQRGGIPTTTDNIGLPESLGLNKAEVEARRSLVRDGSDQFDDYVRRKITWFVVEPDDPTIADKIVRWEAARQIRKVAEFGKIRLYAAAE